MLPALHYINTKIPVKFLFRYIIFNFEAQFWFQNIYSTFDDDNLVERLDTDIVKF